jgi:heat shock protein HtpX
MADPLLHHFGDDENFGLPGTVARPESSPPLERRAFGKLRRRETAEPVLVNTDFRRAIARNKRNTVLLILTLAAISSVLGYVLGWAFGIVSEIWRLPAQQVAQITVVSVLRDFVLGTPRPEALIGAVSLVAGSLAWGFTTLAVGASILSRFVGSRDANPANPAEKRFIDVVEEMAVAAGMPPPRVMVVDTPALNAFASGYSPQDAVITATSGILQACTREELQGVVGHEMGHVADYDVRYVTVVAAMAGVIVLIQHVLLDLARWSTWSSSSSSLDRDDSERDGTRGERSLLTLVVLLIVMAFAIAAPIAAKLVQFAISRQREYLADATSVKLTRNPAGLIHALQRLAQGDTALARPDSPVSALCIAPVRMPFENLFATHPPLEDRIERLRNLGGVAAPPQTR